MNQHWPEVAMFIASADPEELRLLRRTLEGEFRARRREQKLCIHDYGVDEVCPRCSPVDWNRAEAQRIKEM